MNSDDADNLREFARSGDEHAFRRIVENHAPMVYGVAWRRTHDRSLAEDVTQTVFAILARKAASITHQELAGWLHRAAFIETRNASRKESRRQKALSELTATMSAEDPTAAPEWQDISPHLDELMSRLPSEDRQLVVMRFFQQLSYREISRTTGRTEEASRKQMQRALDKLGSLLRRRGVATTGSALAVVLTAQALCTPPASAAIIAASALKAAPALTGGATLSHSLYLMTTQTIVKTSAIALVIAAAPVALLWNQNQDLKQQITKLQTHPVSVSSSDQPETAKTAAVSLPANEVHPERPNRPAQVAAKEKEPTGMEALGNLFKGDNLLAIIEGQSKVESNRQLSRLIARLHLTDDQQTALRGFFDRKNDALKETMQKIKDSGIFDRAIKGGGDLSDEDKALLTGLKGSTDSASDLDGFLKGILTPDQFSEQTKITQEERSEAARLEAQKTLDEVTKHIDLSSEQKDNLFDALSAKHLAADTTSKSSDEDLQAMFSISPDKEEAGPDDDTLRSILTPQQMEAFIKSRDEENAQNAEIFKSLLPGLMKKDGDK